MAAISRTDGQFVDGQIADNHPGYAPYWDWVTEKNAGKSPLNKVSIKQYAYIWRTWLRFLKLRAPRLDWVDARSEDVEEFLRSIVPAANRKKAAGSSPVTRARYRKLLSNVYARAVELAGQTKSSRPPGDPTIGVAVSDELPDQEKADSIVPPTAMWARMERLLQAMPDDPLSNRDRAVLSLIMKEGLSVADLRGVEVTDVILETAREDQISLQVTPVSIVLSGTSETQLAREVKLSGQSSKALAAWMLDRSERRGRLVPHLFIGMNYSNRLTAKSIFIIVSGFVESIKLHDDAIAEPLEHLGPNVLRNGCIRQWIEQGVPFPVICDALAVERRSIRRILKYCSPAAVARYERELLRLVAEENDEGS